MGCVRTFGRMCATILQVVALLVMTLGTAGHAHPGEAADRIAAHVHAHAPAAIDAPADGLPGAVIASADQADAAGGCTALPGAPDCCHGHPMQPAGEAMATGPGLSARVLVALRTVAFASVLPEHQPEPPRPFA